MIIEESDFNNQKDLHKIFLWSIEDFDQNKDLKVKFYQSSENFEVSAAGFLPDGSLLVLERKCDPKIFYENYEIKLKFVSKNILDDHTYIKGVEWLSLADNFESIAVKALENNNLGIFLLTDDNRACFQRTLLLQFELSEDSLDIINRTSIDDNFINDLL
jgi:hypothetical protein